MRIAPLMAACVLGCNALSGLDSLDFGTSTSTGGGAQASSASSSSQGVTSTGGVGLGGSNMGGAPAYDFFDDFERPDGASLGNGWIEKVEPAFSLLNGEVVKAVVTTSYRDNMVYRPASEDVLDIETSVELTLSALPDGNPQLFARVQAATIAMPNEYDGYLLWIDDLVDTAHLSRQRGTVFVTTLVSFALAPPLDFTHRYRMRMRVVGTDPVILAASVELLDAGRWTVIGETTALDSHADRIVTPGAPGFSGAEEAGFTYDNFTRLDL